MSIRTPRCCRDHLATVLTLLSEATHLHTPWFQFRVDLNPPTTHHGTPEFHSHHRELHITLELGFGRTDAQICLGVSASWDSYWNQLPHHSGSSHGCRGHSWYVKVLITIKIPDRMTRRRKAHSFRGFSEWLLGPMHDQESWWQKQLCFAS